MCKITLNYNQDVFRELFHYDETSQSGLRYKKANNCNGPNRRNIGDHVGSIRHNRVWVVKIKNKDYVVHRIIWYLNFGTISKDLVIDHINGNPLDNRLENLRLTSQQVNNSNRSMQSNNQSGKTGVYFEASSEKWKVQWIEDGKSKTKRFISFDDASRYRDKVISEIGHYTERHGK